MTELGWTIVFSGAIVFILLFMAAVGDDPPKVPPQGSLDG